MTHWSIRTRVVASIGLVLGLMLILAGVAYFYVSRVEEQATKVQSDAVAGLVAGSALRVDFSEASTLLQSLLAQTDPSAQQRVAGELRNKQAEVAKAMAAYEATIFTAPDRQLFETFKTAYYTYVPLEQEVVRLMTELRNPREALTRFTTQAGPAHDRALAALVAIQSLNKATADAGIQAIKDAVDATRRWVVIAFLVALVLGVVSGLSLLRAISVPLGRLTAVVDVLRRGDFTQRVGLDQRDELGTLGQGFDRTIDDLTALVRQIQESGAQVSTAVTEIAATAKQQQSTATEVAATTAEIGATSREISATSKELVRTMSDVSSVSEQAASLAGEGRGGLSQLEDIMRRVMDAAGAVNGKLTTLNEKASDIGQVVTTITKVADQTNLLSLNAAIEAEKAGEYGRGFAVVATEIRRLADQTAVATLDIEQMVKAMQAAVLAGVMSMDKFSDEVRRGMQSAQGVSTLLSQVIQQVQTLAPRFESVTEGMQAQATGAEQITEALAQLGDAAQQTVESLRQSHAAIQELNGVAKGLRAGVAKFSLQRA